MSLESGSSLLCLFDAEFFAWMYLAVFGESVELHEVVHCHSVEFAGDVP